MLNHLQLLFNRLAGIAEIEAERLSQSQRVFSTSPRFDHLELPAVWRRKAIVSRHVT